MEILLTVALFLILLMLFGVWREVNHIHDIIQDWRHDWEDENDRSLARDGVYRKNYHKEDNAN